VKFLIESEIVAAPRDDWASACVVKGPENRIAAVAAKTNATLRIVPLPARPSQAPNAPRPPRGYQYIARAGERIAQNQSNSSTGAFPVRAPTN
jgi:hypothetical protein